MWIGRRTFLGGSLLLALPAQARAEPYEDAPPQPFFANVRRLIEALDRLGEPLPPDIVRRLGALAALGTAAAVQEAQALLEPHTLVHLRLGSGGYAFPRRGGSTAALVDQGWKSFLVRVVNPDHLTHPMSYSLDTLALGQIEQFSAPRPSHERQGSQVPQLMLDAVAKSRLDLRSYHEPPLAPALSGLAVEYRLIQILAFSPGRHRAGLMAGALAQPGFVWAPSRKIQIDLAARPSRDIPFRLLDHDGRGTMASLVIRDAQGNIYPSKFGRLAPDMFFQDQVYRADGETVRLPAGRYSFSATRGPEYRVETGAFEVGDDGGSAPVIRLKRWVDPASRGWFSGDVHIHAAGCAHYNEPTIGVAPETIIRHVRGEGLWVGDVLTWGPGFSVQKQYFTGAAVSPDASLEEPRLQEAHGQTLRTRPTPTDRESLIRYDLEISGFPSSPSGHLILLRLKEQDYPGTISPPDWPSWSLPILKWARAQGGVTGFAHCGFGLADIDDVIPSRKIPSFDSIGANEFLVDAAHDAVDFLSGGNSIPGAELTLWYHGLNCGLSTVFVGETDWPCVSDDRVGMARTYVRLDRPPAGDAGYDAWADGLRAGRVYMSDGRAHAFDFRLGDAASGERLKLDAPATLQVSATIAARLDPEPGPGLAGIAGAPNWQEPRWHLERARKPGTRAIDVELIVNGAVAKRFEIIADGTPQTIAHPLPLERSSWVALRVFPAMHTQPVFVELGGKPIRASAESADWCIEAITRLKGSHLPMVAPAEREEAARAYEHALAYYRRIRSECLEG